MNAFESVAPRGNRTIQPRPPRRLPNPRPGQYMVISKPKIELGLNGAPTMKLSRWRAGEPPHVGWWLTKTTRGKPYTKRASWRWFDGQCFSLAVRSGASAAHAAHIAKMPSYREDVLWCMDWPEGARVPRVSPGVAS